jgi:hypothetical protein
MLIIEIYSISSISYSIIQFVHVFQVLPYEMIIVICLFYHIFIIRYYKFTFLSC